MNSTVPVAVSVWGTDRAVSQLTEFAIYPAYQFIHHRSQVLIFFNVLSARNGNLNQDNLSDPFRVIGEEDFEGMQLLRHAFDVIETIHSDHELDTLKFLLQSGNSLFDLFFL